LVLATARVSRLTLTGMASVGSSELALADGDALPRRQKHSDISVAAILARKLFLWIFR